MTGNLPPGGHSLAKIATALPEVWELRPDIFRDARGFFMESYNQAKFAAAGVTDQFVQDNYSCSAKGTPRGLHYQLQHAQAKLCRVVEGEALDVAVDIRAGSPTFGRWTSVVLRPKRRTRFIFRSASLTDLALTERVQFLYKCSEFYDACDEHTILWSDPEIGIAWNIAAPLVSDKDRKAPTLAAVGRELLPAFDRKSAWKIRDRRFFREQSKICDYGNLYSTVTDLARLRGWSTSQPRRTAM